MTIPDSGVDLLLRRATDDLQPDIDQLVAAGLIRGRTRQRRTRIGTAVATLAVLGAIGAGASALPLGPAPDSARDPARPATSTTANPTPAQPSGPLAVAASDIPATVDDILGTSLAGPVLSGSQFPATDTESIKTADFLYDGMLTTVVIDRYPDAVLPCDDEPCPPATDGAVLLEFGPTRSGESEELGVLVWRRGFGITVNSYSSDENIGSAALADSPPLSKEQVLAIASSEVWFR